MNPRKDSVTINFHDLITNKEEYIEQVEFQLSSTTIKFPLYQLIKYMPICQRNEDPKSIIADLSKKLKRQQEHGNVKDSSIIIFFDLLQERSVTITSDEYWDLRRLSKIFNVVFLEEILDQYSSSHSSDIDFTINLIGEYEKRRSGESEDLDDEIFDTNDDISNLESKLKGKLDECFLRESFNKLPVATVYRIIEKNKEEKMTSDLLYDFIRKSKESRLILLPFLDIQKLSDSKLDELLDDYSKSVEAMKKQYSLYLPCDLAFIRQMKEEKRSLLYSINKIKEESNQIQCNFDQISIENGQYQKQIEQMAQNLKDILSKQEQLMKENDELKQAKENLEKANQAKEGDKQDKIVKSFLSQFKDLNEIKLKGIY